MRLKATMLLAQSSRGTLVIEAPPLGGSSLTRRRKTE
jgi:hypothetical protein